MNGIVRAGALPSGRAFTDVFEPLAVRIYRIER